MRRIFTIQSLPMSMHGTALVKEAEKQQRCRMPQGCNGHALYYTDERNVKRYLNLPGTSGCPAAASTTGLRGAASGV